MFSPYWWLWPRALAARCRRAATGGTTMTTTPSPATTTSRSAHRRAVPGDPARGYRAALPQRVLEQSQTASTSTSCPASVVQLARQVRLGHGWPSLRPIDADHVSTRDDSKLHAPHRGAPRARLHGARLPWTAWDPPAALLLNSAAPGHPVEKLDAEGYGEFKKLFVSPSSAQNRASRRPVPRREDRADTPACGDASDAPDGAPAPPHRARRRETPPPRWRPRPGPRLRTDAPSR